MRYLLLLTALLLAFPVQARTIPTADVLLMVAPSSIGGIDNVGCTTQPQVNPCASPQYAADALFASYDLQAKWKATIQLTCSATPGGYLYGGMNISGRIVGQGGTFPHLQVGAGKPDFVIGKYLPLTLLGDPAHPLNCFIQPQINGGACISLSNSAALKVVGIACDTALSQQDGIDIFDGSMLDMANVWFGNGGYPGNTWSNHISLSFNASLLVSGDYDISGSALGHIQYGVSSNVYFNNNGAEGGTIHVRLHGTLNFPGGFLIADSNSTGYFVNVDFNQSAATVTGLKAMALRNSVIDTGAPGPEPAHCNQALIPGDRAVVFTDYSVCR